MTGYLEFEFDLPGALLENLVRAFETIDPGVLTPDGLVHVQDKQGVYQLFFDGDLVYIGKTDAEAGLSKRLARHAQRIQHRHNLDPRHVTFKAIRIYVFTAIDLETQLLKHYGRVKNVLWNGSGFGSNDPGRQRDTTVIKTDNFDDLYPIDLDRTLSIDFNNIETVAQILAALKNTLPFVFRFQKTHNDLADTYFSPPSGQITARAILQQVISLLPQGWLATDLRSHAILYKKHQNYPEGSTTIANS